MFVTKVVTRSGCLLLLTLWSSLGQDLVHFPTSQVDLPERTSSGSDASRVPGCGRFIAESTGRTTPSTPTYRISVNCSCRNSGPRPTSPYFQVSDGLLYEKAHVFSEVIGDTCYTRITIRVQKPLDFYSKSKFKTLVKCRNEGLENKITLYFPRSGVGGSCQNSSHCDSGPDGDIICNPEEKVCVRCSEGTTSDGKACRYGGNGELSSGVPTWIFLFVGFVLVVIFIIAVIRFFANSICCFRTVDRNSPQRPNSFPTSVRARHDPAMTPTDFTSSRSSHFRGSAALDNRLATSDPSYSVPDDPPAYHQIQHHTFQEDESFPPSYHTVTSFPSTTGPFVERKDFPSTVLGIEDHRPESQTRSMGNTNDTFVP